MNCKGRWVFVVLLSLGLLSIHSANILAVTSNTIIQQTGGADAYIDVSKEGELKDEKGENNNIIETWFEFNHTSQTAPNEGKLKTPDFNQEMNQWLEISKQALTPSSIQDKTDNWRKYYDQYMSSQGRICIYDPSGELKKEEVTNTDGNTLLSAPLQWLNAMRINTDLLRNMIVPEGGRAKFQYNDYTKELSGYPKCTDDDPGAILKSESVPATNRGVFDLLYVFFENLFKKTDKGDASIRTKVPNENYLTNLISMKQSDLQSPDPASKYGMADTFRPASVGIVDETKIHGKIPQENFEIAGKKQTVEINFELTNAGRYAIDFIKCNILPQSKQAEFIEKECKDFPAPRVIAANERGTGIPDPPYVPIPGEETNNLSCSGGELDLGGGGGGCDLCGTDQLGSSDTYLTAGNKTSLPEGDIPPLLKQIINSAANKYDVPASVILAMMHEEGSFSRSDWQWTDETVAEWSKCELGKEIQDSCKSHKSSTGALGPLGWIPGYFSKYTKDLSSMDSGRTPNPCNLFDSIYTTAAMLKNEIGDKAGSCQNWTKELAKEARVAYVGGVFGSLNDPISVERTAKWFSAFNCQ